MVVSNSRSQWRSYVAIVLVLLIPFISWLSFAAWKLQEIAPDENAQHLKEFLESMPSIEGIYSRQSGGTTYLQVEGTLPSWLLLPSAPPMYSFDTTGKLVDWTSDYGDDPAFRRRWPLGVTRRRLTPSEALELTVTTDSAK